MQATYSRDCQTVCGAGCRDSGSPARGCGDGRGCAGSWGVRLSSLIWQLVHGVKIHKTKYDDLV